MGRVLEPEVMEGDDEAAAYDELDRRRGDVIFQGFAESALWMGVRSGTVLDVGTGSGRVVLRLAALNPALAIDAIDLSNSMLTLARTNAARKGITNVRFHVGDAKQLPYDDGAFDLVLCHQLLHQLPDPVIALREIRRVTKPDGGLLVRDIRRLPEPAMSLVLPIWCFGYSARLREQTRASFRAGLTHREFRQLVEEAGLAGSLVRTNGLTHQSIERPAAPYQAPVPGPLPQVPLMTRILKAPYASRPAL
jgi:ubiquinone/menaquinone biosynthesis C-methylase UbiE